MNAILQLKHQQGAQSEENKKKQQELLAANKKAAQAVLLAIQLQLGNSVAFVTKTKENDN